jgi:hypothetical protein
MQAGVLTYFGLVDLIKLNAKEEIKKSGKQPKPTRESSKVYSS